MKKHVRQFVRQENKISEELIKALKSGDKVMISGFGTFEMKRFKAKLGRNPKTGKEVMIDERDVLRFKASKHFWKQEKR